MIKYPAGSRLKIMQCRYHFGAVLWIVAGACVLVTGCATTKPGPAMLDGRQVAVLNQLRNEINVAYGYRDLAPRINLGPCGLFAKAFREEWNARFPDHLNIVFVMSPDGRECFHVLVKLLDGNYFDGGNGVITRRALLRQYRAGTRLEEMTDFDPKRLEKWSYGFNREYPQCPNYSHETTV